MKSRLDFRHDRLRISNIGWKRKRDFAKLNHSAPARTVVVYKILAYRARASSPRVNPRMEFWIEINCPRLLTDDNFNFFESFEKLDFSFFFFFTNLDEISELWTIMEILCSLCKFWKWFRWNQVSVSDLIFPFWNGRDSWKLERTFQLLWKIINLILIIKY